MFRLGLIGFLLVVLFAACGPSDDPDLAAAQAAVFEEAVDVELVVAAEKNAMAFAVERIEAPAGSRVRLVMDNSETTSRAMVHNVVVVDSPSAVDRVGQAISGDPDEEALDPAIVAYTPLAGPGERTAVVFEMPPPGEYPFICTFPGHYSFMQGTLVSTAPPADE